MKKFLFFYFFTASFAVIFSFFIFSPTSVQALGVSPGTVTVDGILVGTEIEKTITLSDPEVGKERLYVVGVEESGARFIHFPKKVLTLSEGETQMPFTFSLQIPGEEDVGSYTALIYFVPSSSIPQASGTTGLILRQGVGFTVNFSTTREEDRRFSVRDIGFEPVERGSAPIFFYRIVNDGNVPDGPNSVRLNLILEGNEKYVENITIDQLPAVPPKESTAVRTTIPKLSPGRYAVSTTFLSSSGTVVHKEANGHLVVPSLVEDVVQGPVVSRLVLFRRFLFIALIVTTAIFIFYSYVRRVKQ